MEQTISIPSNNMVNDEIRANSAISDLISNIIILTRRKDPLIVVIKSPKLLIRGLTELHDMVEMVDIKHSIINQIKFLITNYARKLPLSLNSQLVTAENKPDISNHGVGHNSVKSSKYNSQFEGHMLHTVISGNPGTGKTTVGMILAKIWMALGFVNKSRSDLSINNSKFVIEGGNSGPKPIIMNLITNAVIPRLDPDWHGDSNNQNILISTINESYKRKISELEDYQRNSNFKIDRICEMLNKSHMVAGEIRRKAIKLQPSNTVAIDQNGNLTEWNLFLNLTRELRFGFDNLIREANDKNFIYSINGTNKIKGRGIVKENVSKLEVLNPIIIEDNKKVIVDAVPDIVDPYENMDPKFIVAAREDLIAEYLGQTAPKTKKVLESARGGVLFIDEAYSLCNMDGGSKDRYGEECLTTINEFMSLYPDEIIIIFAGYRDLILKNLFRTQPGLMRRIAHFFEIKDYTNNGLAKIFKQQLAKNSWSLSPDINLEKIFIEHSNLIHGNGGFTEKLLLFAKLVYGENKFDETINKKDGDVIHYDSMITEKMLREALGMIQENSAMEVDNGPPWGMYI